MKDTKIVRLWRIQYVYILFSYIITISSQMSENDYYRKNYYHEKWQFYESTFVITVSLVNEASLRQYLQHIHVFGENGALPQIGVSNNFQHHSANYNLTPSPKNVTWVYKNLASNQTLKTANLNTQSKIKRMN